MRTLHDVLTLTAAHAHHSGFRERHLWFSIVHRPARSRFTSVQRLSCCLSLLMGYMLANIMFFGVEANPGSGDEDTLLVKWREIVIGRSRKWREIVIGRSCKWREIVIGRSCK